MAANAANAGLRGGPRVGLEGSRARASPAAGLAGVARLLMSDADDPLATPRPEKKKRKLSKKQQTKENKRLAGLKGYQLRTGQLQASPLPGEHA